MAAAGEIQEELIIHPYSGGRITSFVVLSCLTACTGGIIFGYDIGVSGGVSSMDAFLQRFFPDVYRRMHDAGEDRVSNYCRFDSQLLTAFTSSLYIAGLATTFVASSVTARRGRRASMLVAGAAIVAGATVGAAAGNIAMLIAGRVLVGVGVGFGNQAVPLYLSEMAPPSRRGAFSNGFQLCIAVGAFAAQAINFATEKIAGGWGWRVSLAVAAVPAAFLAVGVVFLPETPNSLVQQGEDHEKVRALLAKIRGTATDGAGVDDELADIVAADADTSNATARHGMTLMLTRRRYRPQLVMAVMIPFFQQMTGINAIAFYAPVLLRTAGLGESAALLAVVAKQILSIAATLASMLAVDKFGRRTLFLFGGIQMVISQLLIGEIMANQLTDDGEPMSQSSALLLIGLVAVYVAGFAWSWGPLGWLVPSEIFPLEVRSAGQSIAVAVNFTLTTAVAQSFLAMLCRMKAGIFFFFAAWLVAMTVFVYFLLPETKGLPIEQVGKLWADHWFWRRFVVDDSGEEEEEEGRAINVDKL